MNFLDYAAARYHEGRPVITDDEFNKLAKLHNYEPLGTPVDITRAIEHDFRMYSLDKCYVGEPMIKLPTTDIVGTVKLDGAAVSALYINGKVRKGLTRGNGKAGFDITDKLAHLLPSTDIEYGQVTGEILAPKRITNSRNYASGSLNLNDLEEFKTRELIFVAYDFVPNTFDTYKETLEYLKSQGFNTILDSWEEYPTDGTVFRVNSNELYQNLGFTDKHPKGAFALKEISEGVITTLKDVIWQVGRTGVVSPVAIVEPVKVGDATVTRATLHNFKYITDLELSIGCKVEIIRSGEIIPRIIRKVDDNSI